MDAFDERLIARAATFDEVLSDDFEPIGGEKASTDLAARRLAAWCRSSASGDWSQFARRLARDGFTFDGVLNRFSSIRRKASAPVPQWAKDAIWVEAELQRPADDQAACVIRAGQRYPFEDLFIPLVAAADRFVWSELTPSVQIEAAARDCLRIMLLEELATLCAPVLYELFSAFRKQTAEHGADPHDRGAKYSRFVSDMRADGWRRLFEEKPVLLRLIAVLIRQWIESTHLFVSRLEADAARIGRDILHGREAGPLVSVEGSRSDRHNGGQTVLILTFADGARVVYKPKSLQVDVAWHETVKRLNASNPPIDLLAPRAIAREGYGWAEFIEHTGCQNHKQVGRFFRRAGAWLALLHRFVAADMHQENMIAHGEHSVPIDIETIFHSGLEEEPEQPTARDLAQSLVANSIMMVGLLPAYGRSAFNRVFAMGGLTAGWNAKTGVAWLDVNSDLMRPTKLSESSGSNPNLPHINGTYAQFSDYLEDFTQGFEDYARFLSAQSERGAALLEGFAGVPVRKVIRSTRFYYMLQQRLRNHKSMDDGVAWSVQADFIARLANWKTETDPLWSLLRHERAALLSLNVPHFVTPSDRTDVCDANRRVVSTRGISGFERARERFRGYDEKEIAWQSEVIRENTRAAESKPLRLAIDRGVPGNAGSTGDMALREAARAADDLATYAIRRGPGAAWIGFNWFEDAEKFQLTCLGPDLYNGASGIALFLGAHAHVTGSTASRDLALAAMHELRSDLNAAGASRVARTMGIGGASGVGSVIYALSLLATLLSDLTLRDDAVAAAGLINTDVIKADNRLDVMGGSAGAILCLLRLYRDSGSKDVLHRAVQCGEHLLRQERAGTDGRRSFRIEGAGQRPLNGISHGAAGFAYALASLAKASGRTDFAEAAVECVAYEDDAYDESRKNWPDFRGGQEPAWPAQWCHGAPGIGLARLAMARLHGPDDQRLMQDAVHAAECTELSWPGAVDTLCCGALGNIEFLREAGRMLQRSELEALATRAFASVLQSAAMHGDYRWNTGKRQFNLGLFRGLSGVGYACLREVDPTLPNVLICE
jgi:class II lanthipeptide synthase